MPTLMLITPLARRFLDEFYRGFHLAREKKNEAVLKNVTIIDANKLFLSWERTIENPDISAN
jgi:hypothetical protein